MISWHEMEPLLAHQQDDTWVIMSFPQMKQTFIELK